VSYDSRQKSPIRGRFQPPNITGGSFLRTKFPSSTPSRVSPVERSIASTPLAAVVETGNENGNENGQF
jgi:hypothetical protein